MVTCTYRAVGHHCGSYWIGTRLGVIEIILVLVYSYMKLIFVWSIVLLLGSQIKSFLFCDWIKFYFIKFPNISDTWTLRLVVYCGRMEVNSNKIEVISLQPSVLDLLFYVNELTEIKKVESDLFKLDAWHLTKLHFLSYY